MFKNKNADGTLNLCGKNVAHLRLALAPFENWQYAQRQGIFSPGKAIWRRNTLCISRQSNAARRKKARRLGVLTIFKQALSSKGISEGFSRPPANRRAGFRQKRGPAD